jgi:hypothetical protein
MPEYDDPASSNSAEARSATWTGQRTSSVKRAPVLAPEASACTNVSWGEPPCPMINEVRAMTAVGSRPLIAVSAAALAAPYGVVGSGLHVSSYRTAVPEKTASLDTYTSRAPTAAAAAATCMPPSAVTAQSVCRYATLMITAGRVWSTSKLARRHRRGA